MRAHWIVIIIVLLREFFWLLPDNFLVVRDIVRVSDAGMLLMIFVIVCEIGRNPDKIKYLNSSFTPVIAGFVILSLFNVLVSNLNYEESLALGFRWIRSNFFYLFYYVVILLVDTPEKLGRLVKWLMVLCLILVGFTVAQYAMPGMTIFHNPDNDWIFEKRFGLFRLINPGLDMVMLCFFIVIARFIQTGASCRIPCIVTGTVFSLQILLSQTRAYLLSLPLALMVSLAVTGKIRWLIVTAWCLAIVVGVSQMSELLTGQKYENLLTRLLESSVTETVKKQGDVGIRYQTARVFWKYAMEHPITGTGAISPQGTVARRLNYPFLRTDLGYVIMFSQYGLLGIAWLIWLSAVYFRKVGLVYRRITDPELKALLFALFTHYLFMVISFVTLPHFILSIMIVTVALNIGMLEVIHRLNTESGHREELLHVHP